MAETRSVDVATPLAFYGLAGAADLYSTRHLISAGGREALLPSQGLAGQAAIKAAAVAALTWGDTKLQASGHKGWAWVARAVVLVGWSTAAGVNMHRAAHPVVR